MSRPAQRVGDKLEHHAAQVLRADGVAGGATARERKDRGKHRQGYIATVVEGDETVVGAIEDGRDEP